MGKVMKKNTKAKDNMVFKKKKGVPMKIVYSAGKKKHLDVVINKEVDPFC